MENNLLSSPDLKTSHFLNCFKVRPEESCVTRFTRNTPMSIQINDQRTAVDIEEGLPLLLKNGLKIEAIAVWGQYSDRALIPTLIQFLLTHKIDVSTLVLTNVYMENSFLTLIGKYIKKNNHLQHLELDEHALTAVGNCDHVGIKTLCDSMKGNKSLECVFLVNMLNVKPDSFSVINEMLKTTRIRKFRLKNETGNIYGPLMSSILFNAKKLALRTLHFNGHSFNDDAMEQLIESMNAGDLSNSFNYDFFNINVNSENISKFLEAILKNKIDVFHLTMVKSGVDDDNIDSLLEVINDSENLTSLNLNLNCFTIEGMERLCEGMHGNITLKDLTIGGNICQYFNYYEMFKELLEKTAIRRLHLFSCNLTQTENMELDKLSNINPDLRMIPLSSLTKSASKRSKQ